MSFDDAPFAALAEKCAAGSDADAWVSLVRRLQPVLARTVYRVMRNWGSVRTAEIDDVLQDIFLKLGTPPRATLRRLSAENDDFILAYLKVLAANSARDHLKAKYATKRGESRTSQLETHLDEWAGAFRMDEGMERHVLLGQIDAALAADARERTIFWLYYRQGFTAKEIAAIPSSALSVKGVESLIHRLTVAVRGSIQVHHFPERQEGESPLKA